MAKAKSGGWLESIKTILYAGLIAIGILIAVFCSSAARSIEVMTHHGTAHAAARRRVAEGLVILPAPGIL